MRTVVGAGSSCARYSGQNVSCKNSRYCHWSEAASLAFEVATTMLHICAVSLHIGEVGYACTTGGLLQGFANNILLTLLQANLNVAFLLWHSQV